MTAQFAGLLVHTAVVYRRTGSVDRFGQPTRDEALSHSLPCRLSRPSGGEVMQERSHDVVNVTHKLFLDAGADLREDDVVTVVMAGQTEVDPSDDVSGFDPDSWDTAVERAEVKLVSPVWDGVQEHHREVQLTTQRQSGAVAG